MGKLLPSYKKALLEEMKSNIESNTSQYYVFTANPVAYTGTAPLNTDDDYSKQFINNWLMLFGKRLNTGDVVPVIKKNMWSANTVYDRYDNTSNTLFENNNFYVITEPLITGGEYYVYKCIDNNNGANSIVNPSSIATPQQPTTFTTPADGYKWRYIATIDSSSFVEFSTNDYSPIFTDTNISIASESYEGVEVVVISNSGIGYETYTNGVIQSNPNSSIVQIETNSPDIPEYYTNNAIYIYNALSATSQLFPIASYYTGNNNTKWVKLQGSANTEVIYPGSTQYSISPRVVFETDGVDPRAYTVVNTSTNSIHSIVILDSGSNISWANAYIQSNTNYGSGANVYCIVPPPGGHGRDPATELNMKGLAVGFKFSNTESNTIPGTGMLYNKIGIIKNPYIMLANTAKGGRYSANTFNQLLKANVSPSYTFSTGDIVFGANSLARGIVAFSNTSQVFLVGDKNFIDGEGVYTTGSNLTYISIQSRGNIYTKDINPLYVQNINNVNRSNTQTESFKLILQV